MESYLPFLIIGGIAAIVAAIAGLGYLYEKNRTAELKALAESMGLPFFSQGDPALVHTLSAFNLFSLGRQKNVRNMIHGQTEDTDLAIFDYRFTTGHGKHKRTVAQTVVYFDSRQLRLTDFAIRPEGLFRKLGKIIGLDDIDVDERPRFSSMFWLQGSNAAEVRKLFRSDVVQWFEGRPSISAEGARSRLIVYEAARRRSPKEVRRVMEEGLELYKLLCSDEAA
jgi:hypothetical protein